MAESRNTFYCPEPGCGREATFVRFLAEEVVVLPGKTGNERKAPVQRTVVVECHVHGEKWHLAIGHHRTAYDAK